MLYLLRWLNFHIALFICALFLGFLLIHLLVGSFPSILPASVSREHMPWGIPLAIALALTCLYSGFKGTYQLIFWRGILVGKGGLYLLVAHLGPILSAVAISVMVKAGSASGVILAPLFLWSASFYAKGFGAISEVAKNRARNEQC